MLLAMRRARLEVLGTADAPVVFTSDRPEGDREPGDWRGVVVIGDAPSHAANVQVYNTLGDHRADYGGGPGGSALGSCGIVRYARIEFAGGNLDEVATPGAAFTIAGCGSETEIHHVQVHRPTDGIGILGGTASLTHLLVSGSSRGDGIEWSGGFTGTLQFVIAQSLGGAVGMLGSNSDADPERVPISAPRIFNATLVGTPPLVLGSHYGFLLQFGSFATLKNSIVYGFADAGFDLRLPAALLASELGSGKSVNVSHILMHANASPYTTEASGLMAMASMRLADPGSMEGSRGRRRRSCRPTTTYSSSPKRACHRSIRPRRTAERCRPQGPIGRAAGRHFRSAERAGFSSVEFRRSGAISTRNRHGARLLGEHVETDEHPIETFALVVLALSVSSAGACDSDGEG